MAGRRSLGGVVLTAAALAATGCGSSYKLPTEAVQVKTFADDKSYERIAVWPGLAGVTDVLLVPGPQLYFAFKAQNGSPARVEQYSTTEPHPIVTGRFAGVLNPGALAATFPTSIFVLDQGDTAAARVLRAHRPPLGTRGPGSTWYELDCGLIKGVYNAVVDISKYWYVREYNFSGSTPKSKFTDTTFAWVNGVAADADGAVYVSGVIMHCFVDPFSHGRDRTLDNEYRIYRYKRGIDDRYVLGSVGADTTLLRGVWGRDQGFEIVEGTGVGSSHDPRGLSWSNVTGAALFFADRGNDEAQKYDPLSLANSFKLDICDADTTELKVPTDVAVDDSGNVYVVDAGNRRVLRYDPQGHHCIQRVDFESVKFGAPLIGPTAAATGDIDGKNFVYVVDSAANQVVLYRRR